ncbi:unnamed protein product [Anisakis simplex]|uniref:UDP-xylose and UDP-N-acetylglucosamine transporter (inferred by orthology to a human protein) n=1 Tax=Anisakis simplex TaxID=6269 RepID=A0A0M3JA59_ANISI|nr:unnamed protein product [Anisakis simplex]
MLMLITALLASAYLGIVQERMYTAYGKHTREAMFVIHGASLPFFAFMGNDIYNYMLKFCRSSPIELFHVKIPHMWALLFAACVMQ